MVRPPLTSHPHFPEGGALNPYIMAFSSQLTESIRSVPQLALNTGKQSIADFLPLFNQIGEVGVALVRHVVNQEVIFLCHTLVESYIFVYGCDLINSTFQ